MLKLPPDIDPLAAELLTAIFPLYKDSQVEAMAATAELDLTFTQWRMLFVLDAAEADLAIKDLADRISLSVAATGRAVDGMVRAGLVCRREDTVDRRIKRLGLSAQGDEVIVRVVRARRLAAERFVGGLDDAERAALSQAVATLGALTRARLPHLCVSPTTFSSDAKP